MLMRAIRVLGIIVSVGLAAGCGSDKPRGPAIVDASFGVDGHVGADGAAWTRATSMRGAIRSIAAAPRMRAT